MVKCANELAISHIAIHNCYHFPPPCLYADNICFTIFLIYSCPHFNTFTCSYSSGLSKKTRRPVGDEYHGWDKVKRSGIPVPLPDKPFISALSDRRVTVSWNPYIAQGPQPPVTYQVEMCESPEGEWFTARTGKGLAWTSCDTLLHYFFDSLLVCIWKTCARKNKYMVSKNQQRFLWIVGLHYYVQQVITSILSLKCFFVNNSIFFMSITQNTSSFVNKSYQLY